ncbi:MAG: type I restriction enzyme HsdR N-terminal domain-containing protein [Desulfobaccales bacterium]
MARKSKVPDSATIINEIKSAIESSSKKSKRLLFKTLLKNFGLKVKTKERAETLMKDLNDACIFVTPSLIECDRNEWVTLSINDPPIPLAEKEVPSPIQSENHDTLDKLQEIISKRFNTEKEVEIRFILPLVALLGFVEEDRADGYRVEIYEDVRKSLKEADFVLFDGKNRAKDNALLVIEAKTVDKKLEKYIPQARSYAIWLGTPYYLVTNGEDIKVFHFRSAISSDVEVFSGKRQDLAATFGNLYRYINKQAIIEYKRQRK